MNKTFCDVCEKEIPKRDSMPHNEACKATSGQFNYSLGIILETYDLCEKHANAVKQFLDELKTKKRKDFCIITRVPLQKRKLPRVVRREER